MVFAVVLTVGTGTGRALATSGAWEAVGEGGGVDVIEGKASGREDACALESGAAGGAPMFCVVVAVVPVPGVVLPSRCV